MPHLVCISLQERSSVTGRCSRFESLCSRFHDVVMNSVTVCAASVHVVNGINNYFIIVKATTEVAHHVCYSENSVHQFPS